MSSTYTSCSGVNARNTVGEGDEDASSDEAAEDYEDDHKQQAPVHHSSSLCCCCGVGLSSSLLPQIFSHVCLL